MTKSIRKIVISIIILFLFSMFFNPILDFSTKRVLGNQSVIYENWEITQNNFTSNQVIVLNGNLTVREGGNLTLINVILYINSSYDGEFLIRVEDNCGLYIYNSKITAWNNNYEYNFWYLKGSRGLIQNSTIEELSGPRIHHREMQETGCPEGEDCEGSEGVFIGADNFIVRDSIIQNSNRNGLNIKANNVSVHNNIIRNNFFEQINVESDLDMEGNLIYSTSAQIYNNDIFGSDDSNGIDLFYTEVKIYNNTIHDNEFNGIEADHSNVTISNNTFFRNEDNAINIRDNSSLVAYDNIIYDTYNYDGKYFGTGCAFWLDYNFNNQIHIYNNYIANNIIGVAIHSTSNVLIENNTLIGHETGILADNWHCFFETEYIPNSTKNITIRKNDFINNFIIFDVQSDTDVLLINNNISGVYVPIRYILLVLSIVGIVMCISVFIVYRRKRKKKRNEI